MLKATNPRKLHNRDWRYAQKTEDNEAMYLHRFCVYRYEKTPIIFAIISVNAETLSARVDVYNEDDSVYQPYYFIPCGNYEPILNKITDKINGVLNYYQIKEIEDVNN